MQMLLKRVAGTFGLRVTSMLLTLVTSVALARLLGTNGFGAYSYVMSWGYLLNIPASLGFDGLLGREISIFLVQSAWKDLKSLNLRASLLSLEMSLVMALVVGLIAWLIYRDQNPDIMYTFWLAMISLPFVSVTKTQRGTLRGLHSIVFGLMPEAVLTPFLQIAILLGIFLLLSPNALTAPSVMGAYSAATVISAVAALVMCRKILPEPVKKIKTSLQDIFALHRGSLSWIGLALPFMMIEGVHVLNGRADTIMLGLLKGVDAAGVYDPVNRASQFSTFILVAFHGPLAPTIASLFSEGKKKELQQILKKTTRIAVLTSIVMTLLLVILGYPYLQVYGPGFVDGYTALVIRSVGKLLYSVFAISPLVLSMTGYAKSTAIASVVGVTINVVLNAVLIPQFSLNGAAFATVVSMIGVGIVESVHVYHKVGINSTLFSFRKSA